MSHLLPLYELLKFLNAFVYCMSTTNTSGISASGQKAQKLRQKKYGFGMDTTKIHEHAHPFRRTQRHKVSCKYIVLA